VQAGLGRGAKTGGEASTPIRQAIIAAETGGEVALVGALLYGSGMRLLECLTLRVKVLDLERGRFGFAGPREPRIG